MGVKSTHELTRKEAIEKYVYLKLNSSKYIRKIEAEATIMSDKELEVVLQNMNDDYHGGEGFENYWIKD